MDSARLFRGERWISEIGGGHFDSMPDPQWLGSFEEHWSVASSATHFAIRTDGPLIKLGVRMEEVVA